MSLLLKVGEKQGAFFWQIFGCAQEEERLEACRAQRRRTAVCHSAAMTNYSCDGAKSAHKAQPWENCVTKGPREAMQGGCEDQRAGKEKTQSPSPQEKENLEK